MRVLGSKLEDDTADCSQIIAIKLGAQSDEQVDLLWVERLAVRIIIVRNLNATAIAATNSFDRVGTHERCNVITNGPLADIELTGQIVVCIMPFQA